MQQNIFESAKAILERTEYSREELAALTKVMLSMKFSYGDINTVRTLLEKNHNALGNTLIGMAATIGSSTSLFNSFVSEYKKNPGMTEDVDELSESVSPDIVKRAAAFGLSKQHVDKLYNSLKSAFGNNDKVATQLIKSTIENWEKHGPPSKIQLPEELEEVELNESVSAKLANDVASLKRIGWKLDKVTKHLITSKEYGIKLTADLIASLFNPPKGAKPGKTVKVGNITYKIPAPVKKASWPKDPPKSKINDVSHAEGYLHQAVNSGEASDIYGNEAYEMLVQAGYSEKTAMAVMKNMGWDDEVKRTRDREARHTANATTFAKKMATKKAKNMKEETSTFRRITELLK